MATQYSIYALILSSLVILCVCVLVRTAWVQKIKAASEDFIETEKKKREKAYQGQLPHSPAQLHWLTVSLAD